MDWRQFLRKTGGGGGQMIDLPVQFNFFWKFLRGEYVKAEVVEKERKEGRSEERKD